MQDKENLLTRIEINTAIVGKRKDGIIHVYYKPGTVIDVELQNKMLHIFKEITNNKKSLFIFEAGPHTRLTKEARMNALKMEPEAPIMATAVLVQSWYQKVIAQFYYKFYKPRGNYTVTWNFTKGINWLHQHIMEEAA